MNLLTLLRSPTLPLPPMRSTREILEDVDHQVGRLASIRDRASRLMESMGEGHEGPQ